MSNNPNQLSLGYKVKTSDLLEKCKAQKIKTVLIDVEKEFEEVIKSSKDYNCTDPTNFLEHYKP